MLHFRVDKKVSQETRINCVWMRPNYRNMLINSSWQYILSDLANTRDAITRNVKKNVVLLYLYISQLSSLLVGDIGQSAMGETVVIDVLASNERERTI